MLVRVEAVGRKERDESAIAEVSEDSDTGLRVGAIGRHLYRLEREPWRHATWDDGRDHRYRSVPSFGDFERQGRHALSVLRRSQSDRFAHMGGQWGSRCEGSLAAVAVLHA